MKFFIEETYTPEKKKVRVFVVDEERRKVEHVLTRVYGRSTNVDYDSLKKEAEKKYRSES